MWMVWWTECMPLPANAVDALHWCSHSKRMLIQEVRLRRWWQSRQVMRLDNQHRGQARMPMPNCGERIPWVPLQTEYPCLVRYFDYGLPAISQLGPFQDSASLLPSYWHDLKFLFSKFVFTEHIPTQGKSHGSAPWTFRLGMWLKYGKTDFLFHILSLPFFDISRFIRFQCLKSRLLKAIPGSHLYFSIKGNSANLLFYFMFSRRHYHSRVLNYYPSFKIWNQGDNCFLHSHYSGSPFCHRVSSFSSRADEWFRPKCESVLQRPITLYLVALPPQWCLLVFL